jgi:hypothetical protein
MTALYVATLAGAGRVDVDHVACVDLLRAQAAPLGVTVHVRRFKSGGVERNRNLAVADFLRRHETHLVFLDSGVIFDPADLLTMVDAGLPLVGAAPPGKAIDWTRVGVAARGGAPDAALKWIASDPMVSITPAQLQAEPIRVPGQRGLYLACNGLSTAYMVIARATLTAFVAHYHQRIAYVTDPGFDDGFSRLYLVFHHQRDPENDSPAGGYKGEDFAFCQLWRMMGGQVAVYADAKVIQNGTQPFCLQLSRLVPAAKKILWTPGD